MTAETAPVALNPRDAALQLTVTKAIAEHTAAALDDLRKQVGSADVFLPSERLVVTSPLDRRVRLATVTATDPADEAVIVNEQAFVQWMLENCDQECADVDTLIGSTAQVIAALREHCPPDVLAKLVTTERAPTVQARNAVLKLSAKAGAPVAPRGEAPAGVEVRPKQSTIQVRLEEDAMPKVVELWHARAVDPLQALTS